MLRFSVIGVKGGVGKSTIAYYLSSELSKSYKVLIVDRDYNSTISRSFGLRNGLVNYVAEGVEGDFMTERGNLRILSLSNFQPSRIPTPREISKYYREALRDVDVVVTDNPPTFNDDICNLEMRAYWDILGEFNCSGIPVTTPGLSLQITLSSLNYFPEVVNRIVPNPYITSPALVINMVREDVKVEGWPEDKIVKIPFNKDILFKGFMNVPPPSEINRLVEKISFLLERKNSIKT
ncbi:chromosome partitioning protein ParA [Candidatus Acidianus copahuensis]|uniref:Chromosome partitioning protein ParA n=1 Tax=Candidatus Acidianus copahuensis TaxID=1160895 RepID=A0A031LQN7_9CREN|nr:ParA family protein [Candidatus Acidianus copahuensis]EZQ10687.1 chromosome partitioning protein ParA [Candidatus Acidianus copahuensis]